MKKNCKLYRYWWWSGAILLFFWSWTDIFCLSEVYDIFYYFVVTYQAAWQFESMAMSPIDIPYQILTNIIESSHKILIFIPKPLNTITNILCTFFINFANNTNTFIFLFANLYFFQSIFCISVKLWCSLCQIFVQLLTYCLNL
mgnify:FL=1